MERGRTGYILCSCSKNEPRVFLEMCEDPKK